MYFSPEYILAFIILFIIVVFVYIKLAFPFWNIQPVAHTYSHWLNWKKEPYIVHIFPPYTKYVVGASFAIDLPEPGSSNHHPLRPHVKSQRFDELTQKDRDEIINLYRSNYIPSDRIICSIEQSILKSYCVGKSVISRLFVPENQLVGVTISRGVTVFVSSNIVGAYYFDYFCIYRNLANSKIATYQLFQTHEWNQRLKDKDVHVSMFRKDGELCRGVVPFVQFRSATFYLRNLKIDALPPEFQLKLVRQNTNMRFVNDFIDSIGKVHLAGAYMDKPAIYELVAARQLFVGILTKGDQLFAIYFLKNANTKYEELDQLGGDTLHLVASFSNIQPSTIIDGQEIVETGLLFYCGFQHCIREVLRDNPKTSTTIVDETNSNSKVVRRQAITERFGILVIDSIGNSMAIMDLWKRQHVAMVEMDAAYYLYNYIWSGAPVHPSQGFFLL